MSKGRRNRIYHFSGDKNYKTTEVIKILCKLKSYNYKKLVKKINSRIGQDLTYKLDSKKTRKELNWRPFYSFQKALNEVITYQKSLSKELLKESFNYKDIQFR